MRNCITCNKELAKTTKGNLCHICYRNRNKDDMTIADDNETTGKNGFNHFTEEVINIDESLYVHDNKLDRTMIDIMKDNLLYERRRENEMAMVLKNQIQYLKGELECKNNLIEKLISHLPAFNDNNHNLHIQSIPSDDIRTGISNNMYSGISNNIRAINDKIFNSDTIIDENFNEGNLLATEDNNSRNNEYYNRENDDVNNNDNNPFNLVTKDRGHKNRFSKHADVNTWGIETSNQFNELAVRDNNYQEDFNDIRDLYDQENINRHNVQQNDIVHRKRPHVVVNPYPDRDRELRTLRPGINSYQDAVKEGKRTVIFSSSMTRSIRVREFNKYYTEGTARFRRFHGATAKRLEHYVLPTLMEESPEIVVIHIGGNDLPTSKNNPTPIEDVANRVIDTAKLCENFGAKKILIAGVIVRNLGYMEKRRLLLNSQLKKLCMEHNYIFIDNENITRQHLLNDNVHLNEDGSVVLAENMLSALSSLF